MKKFTEKGLRAFLNSEIKKAIISEGLLSEDISDYESELTLESDKIQLEDVKNLTEEIKRMKELIDFRNPLLKKD
jgi:hypothetical protein